MHTVKEKATRRILAFLAFCAITAFATIITLQAGFDVQFIVNPEIAIFAVTSARPAAARNRLYETEYEIH